MRMSRENRNPPSTRRATRERRPARNKCFVCFAQTNFPGQAGVLDGGERRRAGAAVVAADGDDVGASLGNARGDDADTRAGDEFHANARFGIYGVQIVDQLRKIFDAVNVVMRRRRNQRCARRGMANSGDVLGYFCGGQLAAFAGFGTLRHLDFEFFRANQIFRGDAEAPGGYLFDFVRSVYGQI